MKAFVPKAAFALFAALAFSASATTRYVDANGTNPVSPYTSWATAATNIQDALMVAGTGQIVLVTNGVYQYGGFNNDGTNRACCINSGVIIQSVNGPAVTTIVGAWDAATNGPNSTRCVYLTVDSSLSGFTLTNGSSKIGQYGGAIYCERVSCVVSNCIITGGAAHGSGGGVFQGTEIDCIIANNISASAAGIFDSIAINSLFVGNSCGYYGAAAGSSTLVNCTVVNNHSGVDALAGCYVTNCIAYYNSYDDGEGSSDGNYFNHCCLGSIPYSGTNNITNPPLFVNTNGDYHLSPSSPCINAGTNSIVTTATDLDGNPRIVYGTVDLGAYESPYNRGVHYVSLASTNPVSPFNDWSIAATNIQDAVDASVAGDFVIVSNGVYGNGGTVVFGSETNRVALTNAITLLSLNGPQAATIIGGTQTRCVYVGSNSVLSGFTLTNGGASGFGDTINEQSGGGAWCETGGVISNCFVTGNSTHAANGMGAGIFGGTVYNCIITNNSSVNNSIGGGAAYANLYNCLVISNSTFWLASYGGGLYYGSASNCAFIGNSAYQNGGSAYRSKLFNCTLSGNYCNLGVAGAYQSFLTNCVLTGNRGAVGGTFASTNYNCTFAGNSAGPLGNGGGGVSGGISYNCIFTNNSCANGGGGAASATLYNCLLVGNFASNGGGADNCTLNNCTVVGNTATNSGGGVFSSSGSVNNSIVYYNRTQSGIDVNYSSPKFNFSCSFPTTLGIITTNPPLFVNSNSDFHLLANSPCINSGTNFYATNGIPFIAVDLDGNLRIVSIAADLGAYEYQSVTSLIPAWWLSQFGLAMDGSADNADADGDGVSNYAEWKCGTNPTNSASVLAVQSPAATTTNATITWQSVSGKKYFVQRGSDLSAQPIFMTIATNIVGQVGTTSYNDTTATNSISYFYRVGVQ